LAVSKPDLDNLKQSLTIAAIELNKKESGVKGRHIGDPETQRRGERSDNEHIPIDHLTQLKTQNSHLIPLPSLALLEMEYGLE
jgi:hypothetical protein